MNEVLCKAKDNLELVGVGLWVATVVLRPFVPNRVIQQLGLIGKAVEVLTGNTRNCKNHVDGQPEDRQARPSKRP